MRPHSGVFVDKCTSPTWPVPTSHACVGVRPGVWTQRRKAGPRIAVRVEPTAHTFPGPTWDGVTLPCGHGSVARVRVCVRLGPHVRLRARPLPHGLTLPREA